MDTTLPRVSSQGTVLRSRALLARMSDERLVDQIRRGNEVAFEVAYDRHHRGILSFTRHMLTSREEAEDAVQHTFMAAYNSLLASERDVQLGPWLYTIARNRSLSILRARRETASDDIEISTDGFSAEVQTRSDLRQLVDDMRELPEQQREALVLSEVGDLSHADVAQVLGCEPAKVKSLVFQARSGLIERRNARDTPCEEIREQIATLRGGALRRGSLRRHIKACSGCSEFRDQVKHQRALLGLILPVIPTLGLKETALAAMGIGGGGGGGAILGGGGVGAALVAKVGVAKLAVVAVVAGAASIGGGMAAVESSPSRADSPSAAQSTELGGPGGGGSPALLAGTDTEQNRAQTRKAEKRERDAKKRERKAAKRERKAERKRSATNGEGPNAQERAEKREQKAKVQRARGRENALTRGRGYKRGLRRKTGGDTPVGQRAPDPKPTSDEGDGDTAVDQEPTDAVGDLTPTDRRTKPLDD